MDFIAPSHEITRDILLIGLAIIVASLFLTVILTLVFNRGKITKLSIFIVLSILGLSGIITLTAPFVLFITAVVDSNKRISEIERIYGVTFEADIIRDLGYPHEPSEDELVTYGIARDVEIVSMNKTSDIILIWKNDELRLHWYSDEEYLGLELPRID